MTDNRENIQMNEINENEIVNDSSDSEENVRVIKV